VATSTGFLSSPARVMTCMVPRSNLADVTRFRKAVLLGLCAVVLLSGLGASTAAALPSSSDALPTAESDALPSSNSAREPLIVIGVGGLLWSDISFKTTPALF